MYKICADVIEPITAYLFCPLQPIVFLVLVAVSYSFIVLGSEVMLHDLKLFSQDITLTKALEESLKPYGVFESEEELQHRLLEYSILKPKEECALRRLLWLLWQVERSIQATTCEEKLAQFVKLYVLVW